MLGFYGSQAFYTRMHAAGKADTLSSILILLGCSLYVLDVYGVGVYIDFITLKIVLVAAFIFIGSPTATHAMMDAGFEPKCLKLA